MIEAVAWRPVFCFCFKYLFQTSGRYFGNTGRKDDTFTFLDIHFEIAGYIKVFVEIVSSFLFFRILDTPIPVGVKMEFIFLVQLHEQFRIAGIHTGFYTVFHQLIVTACLCIFMGILPHASESQKWPETQGCCRMGVDQSITNQNPVFVMYKNFFFTENNSSHTVSRCRNMFTIEFTDIFMPIRTIIISLIFM